MRQPLEIFSLPCIGLWIGINKMIHNDGRRVTTPYLPRLHVVHLHHLIVNECCVIVAIFLCVCDVDFSDCYLNSPPQDAVVRQTVYAICSATTIQHFCEVGNGSKVQNCPVFSTSHSIVFTFLPPAMYYAFFVTANHLVSSPLLSSLLVNALMRGHTAQ